MSKEFHVEQNNEGKWEVRDRADVFVSEHDTKRDAQRRAANANNQVSHFRG